MGLIVLCQDEAGPYQTKPYPGASWRVSGRTGKYDHEYIRNGTAKIMTLLRPHTGLVWLKGVRSTKNAVLHPWIKESVRAINKTLKPIEESKHKAFKLKVHEHFGEAIWSKELLLEKWPVPRFLLIWDNLTGHKSYEMVKWLFEHGVIPLYTPLGGSWLNMTESIQGILKRRALGGTHPKSPEEIINAFEAAVKGWNKNPTPFVWHGKRFEKRRRAWERRRLAASGGSAVPYRGTLYWAPE